MAFVTVAVPVYSDFPWYIHSLESCLKQTSSDFKLLVCINRPGDRSIDEWIAKRAFPFSVRVIHAEQSLPMAENWNRCIENCDTEWLVILHEDDELLPDCIERLNRAIASEPKSTAIIGGAEIIDRQGRRILHSLTDKVRAWVRPKTTRPNAFENGELLNRLCWANFVYSPAFCLNLAKLGSLRFSGRWKFVVDLDFYASIFLKPGQSVSLPESIARYRRHEGAATSQMTKTLLRFDEEISYYSELSQRVRVVGLRRASFIARLSPLIRANIIIHALKALFRLDFSTLRELCTLLLKGLWMN